MHRPHFSAIETIDKLIANTRSVQQFPCKMHKQRVEKKGTREPGAE
jgi:hypothetical protein